MSLQLLLDLDLPEPDDTSEAMLQLYAQKTRLAGVVHEAMMRLYPDFETIVDTLERRETALRNKMLFPTAQGEA